MDKREDPRNERANEDGFDARDRLRASIARQAASIRRAAANRYGPIPPWPDRGPSDAAFLEAAKAWERGAQLPQRGWEPNFSDPMDDDLEPEAPTPSNREASGNWPRLAQIGRRLSMLGARLFAFVRPEGFGQNRAANKDEAGQARSVARVSRPHAAEGPSNRPTDEAAGSAREGGKEVFDPIGDFADRILEELLDKHSGPRNKRGRR